MRMVHGFSLFRERNLAWELLLLWLWRACPEGTAEQSEGRTCWRWVVENVLPEPRLVHSTLGSSSKPFINPGTSGRLQGRSRREATTDREGFAAQAYLIREQNLPGLRPHKPSVILSSFHLPWYQMRKDQMRIREMGKWSTVSLLWFLAGEKGRDSRAGWVREMPRAQRVWSCFRASHILKPYKCSMFYSHQLYQTNAI